MTAANGRPRIGITYAVDRGNPVKLRLFERLRSWADLVLFDPAVRHPAIPELGLDCYHMAAWSPEAFSDFALAAASGVPTVNSYRGAATTEDRVLSMRACAERGLPVPEFEYGPADGVALDPPVLVKPRHETAVDGHELRLVASGDLAFEDERVVQRYVSPRHRYTLFRVGDHVRATRLAHRDGRAVETAVPGRFRDLTDSVAECFDLRLFELDLLVHGGVHVIDVNPVASLAGVTDAVDVYEELLGEVCGRGKAGRPA